MAKVTQHEPEHQTSSVKLYIMPGCCCCCCCCAHSLGGLIGAATAGPITPKQETSAPERSETSETIPSETTPTAHRHYWPLLIALALATAFLSFAPDGDGEVAMWTVALALPLIQLAASALLAVHYSLRSTPTTRARRRHLGRITLRAFVGGLIGALLMLPIFFGG